MEEFELEESDRPPFATRLERPLAARYGDVSGPIGDYMLAPDRLEEAQAVEEYAWAFRLAETLDNGPTVGIGRIKPAGPPRLRECLKAGRRHNWGLEHMLIAAELNDLLLAHGYDLGISAEAEGAAELLAGEFARVMAWETIVALCQAPTDELTDVFDMVPDLLPSAHEMAANNVERAARHACRQFDSGPRHSCKSALSAPADDS